MATQKPLVLASGQVQRLQSGDQIAGTDVSNIAESQVTNLTTDLAAKAPLDSPTFTGTPAAPTATAGTNTTQIATTAFVEAAVGAAGGGSVTSVGLSLPGIFSVSGSPITTAGTLTGTLATQSANAVWAGPATGAAAAPTFRALVAADIPDLSGTYLTANQTITLSGDVSGSGSTAITTTIGTGKVTNTMLAGSIAASNLVGTDIATLGTVTTGTWQATAIGLAYGGTGSNLSGTGPGFLKQASTGATVTVAALAAGDLPGSVVLTTGSYADPAWITSLSGSKLTGTVVATNGVVTTGSYADPAWITSLAGSKISGNISGNAASITGSIAESQVTNLTTDMAAKAQALARTSVKATAYTAAAGDLVPVDTTSGAVTITLAAAPADRSRVAIKHIVQGGSNNVTVAAGGADVFNKASGSTSFTLPLLNQGVLLEYDAATAIWTVISDDLPLSQLDARYLAPTGNGSGLTGLTGAQISGDISGNAANVTGTVAIGHGGTGQVTAAAAFDALSPVTTLGDLSYRGSSSNVRLAGNTTTAKNFLAQTGTGSASAAPAWGTIATGDVSGLGTAATHAATDFATAISLAAPSVLYSTPVTFSNSGGTFSGTLGLVTQSANTVLAGPTTGTAATPTMRSLVAADIPNIAESQVTNLTTDLAAKAPLASPSFTGTVKIQSHYGDITTDTDGATVTFDCSVTDWHQVTLGGNRTLAVSNDVTGQQFTIVLIQDATGSRTVTWWSGIKWAGNATPVLTTTASKADIFTFKKTGAGAYYGLVAGQNL